MLICWKCRTVGRKQDLGRKIIVRDYETDDIECRCGGCYAPAFECKECGDYFLEEEVEHISGTCYCPSCLRDNACDEYALEIGEENKDKVELNGFLAWHFGKDLEKVLLDYVMNDPVARETLLASAERYCMEDTSYFADFLERKRGK